MRRLHFRRIRKIFDKASPYLAIAAIVIGVAYGGYYQRQGSGYAYEAAVSAASANRYARLDHTLQKRATISSNRHHGETSKQNQEILFGESLLAQGEQIIMQYHVQNVAFQNQLALLQTEIGADVKNVGGSLVGGQNTLIALIADLDKKLTAICATLPAGACPAN